MMSSKQSQCVFHFPFRLFRVVVRIWILRWASFLHNHVSHTTLYNKLTHFLKFHMHIRNNPPFKKKLNRVAYIFFVCVSLIKTPRKLLQKRYLELKKVVWTRPKSPLSYSGFGCTKCLEYWRFPLSMFVLLL